MNPWFLWDIVVNGVEYSLVYSFLRRQSTRLRVEKWQSVIATLAAIGALSCLNYVSLPPYVSMIAATVIDLFLALYICAGPVGMCILNACICSSVLFIADNIVSLIVVNTVLEQYVSLLSPSFARILPTGLYMCVVAGLFQLGKLLPRSDFEVTKPLQVLIGSTGILLTCLSGLLTVATIESPSTENVRNTYNIFASVYLLVTVTCLVLLYLIAYYYHQGLLLAQEKSNAEWKVRQHMKVQMLMRSWKHEQLHFLGVLAGCVDRGDLSTVRKMVMELSAGLTSLDIQKWSGDTAIDAALATGEQAAVNKGIGVKICSGTIPANPLSALDTAMLIDNLMENATEACESVIAQGQACASIEVELCNDKDVLFFRVQNPSTGVYRWDGMSLRTTKTGQGHGNGLRLVHEIVEKHGGSLTLSPLPDSFIAEVYLPLCGDVGNPGGRE